MSHSVKEQGFSTVELLISLFIAAAFIGTGFQLFSAVTKDSNEARLRATASSKANTYLQESVGGATIPCVVVPPGAATNIPTSDLPQASYTVGYSCPYGVGAQTTRVTVAVTYGSDPQTVQAVLDVTR